MAKRFKYLLVLSINMKVKEYIGMVKVAEQTRVNLAIFDPAAGIRQQQGLYAKMEGANNVFRDQFRSKPYPKAELNSASKQAVARVLDYIALEELLTADRVTHYRSLL